MVFPSPQINFAQIDCLTPGFARTNFPFIGFSHLNGVPPTGEATRQLEQNRNPVEMTQTNNVIFQSNQLIQQQVSSFQSNVYNQWNQQQVSSSQTAELYQWNQQQVSSSQTAELYQWNQLTQQQTSNYNQTNQLYESFQVTEHQVQTNVYQRTETVTTQMNYSVGR